MVCQHCLSVHLDFLTYSGLLSSIPDEWKRSILNSEEALNNSDEHNLTSACERHCQNCSLSACAGNAADKPLNLEIKLNEQNLPVKAVYELPFKVTMENKLRCCQFKVIHCILPTKHQTLQNEVENISEL